MTPRQRELARHSLGLPNKQKKSYRNRFYASKGHKDFPDWTALVSQGLAKRYPCFARTDDIFMLTLKGARSALNQGEALCSEDFPQQ